MSEAKEKRGDDNICPCGADYNFTCYCTKAERSKHMHEQCRLVPKLQAKIDAAIELCNKEYSKDATIQYAICEFVVRLGNIREALQRKT